MPNTQPDPAFVGKKPAPFKWKSDPPPSDPKSGLTKVPIPTKAPSAPGQGFPLPNK